MSAAIERIAVTGAAGFIGANLCGALLAAGYQVLGIDDLSAGTRDNVPSGVNFREVDILDEHLSQHFFGCEAVFHLAAKNCLPDCAANPVATARVNVTGTANVLEAARKAGVRHIVYADSSAEYEGVEVFPTPIDRVKPLSIYACSKRGGALIAEAFAELHGIKVTFVRYFNVYGPAQDFRRVIPPVMSAFVTRLLEGKNPIIYGDGKKSRDFIHVDDVNAFHLKLIREPGLQGGTYNLGTGKDHSVLEILELLKRYTGIQLPADFKAPLPLDADRTLADISATVATGWSPKVTLEQGLRDFVEYTRRRLATS